MRSSPAIATLLGLAAVISLSMLTRTGIAVPPQSERGDRLEKLFQTPIDHFSAKQEDVHSVLRRLISKIHLHYTIAPDVEGRVSLDVGNVTFEDVLQRITREVESTYRVDKGTLNIIHRQTGSPTVVEWPEGGARQPVMIQDADHLYILSYDRLAKVRKRDFKLEETMLTAGSMEGFKFGEAPK